MSKVFTYEVQKANEDGPWSARDGVHTITMSDEWTSGMIAQQAARDHEKAAGDDSWRVVVWNGDDVHNHLRDPDWIIYGRELAGDCWCHPIFIQDGVYEWYCPSHGDRSWRPKAKAFQATLGKSETALAVSVASEMPPAWADLIEGLTLLATHQNDAISPFNCTHDTLNVMADPTAFTVEELARLDELGFHTDSESYASFYSFRFGSA